MATLKHPDSVLAYFERIGAEPLNFRRAIVKLYKGVYYQEKALIKINSEGEVTSTEKEYEPTPEEFELMKKELAGINYPKPIRCNKSSLDDLVPRLRGPHFVFYDQETSEIIMVQERLDISLTDKKYIPWVMMSDGDWEKFEPEGPLPFFKPEKSQGPNAWIMIHEGAKAADAAQKIVANQPDHPWHGFLSKFEHWGMIGGALAPHRTDYNELHKRCPLKVVYACDHDPVGESALAKVSKKWGKAINGLIYGANFPKGWDIADPIPDELFSRISGRYIGPKPQTLIVPATYATETIPPVGKGRPSHKIKEIFAEEWMHCVTPEVFVNRHWPSLTYSKDEFDNKIRPFSDVAITSNLLKKDFSGKADQLIYDPRLPPGLYSGHISGQRTINTFEPCVIEPEKGDVTPFLKYLEDLIPHPGERHELMRWIATLIARPDIRIIYGVLLISETQGVGKGTLGDRILKHLVGSSNVSFPTENTVVDSQYNYWTAHKRLAIIHEIYAGNSSKAYNKLKSIITDSSIEVNKKYQATYNIECWIHVLACSNSKRALKVANDDRRWFIPKVSENKKPRPYWEQFINWLDEEGGLAFIRNWAEEFVKDPDNLVQPGTIAPMSNTKDEIVREGYSPGQILVESALRHIMALVDEGKIPPTTYVLDLDLVNLIKDQLYEGRQVDKLERPGTVRAVAKHLGWHCGEVQAQLAGWGLSRRGARVIALDPDIAARVPKSLDGGDVPEAERLRPFDLRTILQF
jgi:hypothetical protein